MPRPTSRPAAAAVETPRAAVALVLGWLAGRDLSSAELAARLRRRGCPDEVAAQALDQLRRTGAVNDERVAMSRARVESASRGRGRQRVLLRLRSIGIDEPTARRAVDAVFADIDEAGLLERAIDRRLKSGGGRIRTPAEYRRLCAALVRLGFSAAAIRTALARRRSPAVDVPEEE